MTSPQASSVATLAKGHALTSTLRAALKMTIFVLALLSYFLTTGLLYPFVSRRVPWARRLLVQILRGYSRFCLWFMGITVEIKNAELENRGPNRGLIVCNHLSYLDVLILCARYPACFVTSVEVRNTPVLGQLSELAGCLFVERRNRENLSKEVRDLTEALKREESVVIFPEATSTNGDEVLRFRRPLFQSALDSKKPILPLTLNYRSIDGAPITRSNRDLVCWYDDMTFIDHLWSFFKQGPTRVELVIGKAINPGEFESTEALALRAHQQVSESFKSLNH
jgi:lyso-ornithine lipid O-acyltransferase